MTDTFRPRPDQVARFEARLADLLLLDPDQVLGGTLRIEVTQEDPDHGYVRWESFAKVDAAEAIASWRADPPTLDQSLAETAIWHALAITAIEAQLRRRIQGHRDAGARWRQVGAAFGVTRQAAWERFRRFDQLGVVDPVEALVDPGVTT